MKTENIPADIKSKSLKDARDEIKVILTKLENQDTDLDASINDYKRLIQLNNHIDNSKYLTKINLFRSYLSDKMNQLNDEFPASSWYLKNWIQDRNIKRTATM